MTAAERLASRWLQALTDHDLDAAVACFHPAYHDEAPARRGEVVNGRDEVRDNFARLFRDIPDLRADLLRTAGGDELLWMEWRMSGSGWDGTRMEFAGVNIFEIEGDQFVRGWIYTELVRESGGVKAQLDRMTGGDQ